MHNSQPEFKKVTHVAHQKFWVSRRGRKKDLAVGPKQGIAGGPGVKCGCVDLRMFTHVKCGFQCGLKSALYPLVKNLLPQVIPEISHTTLLLAYCRYFNVAWMYIAVDCYVNDAGLCVYERMCILIRLLTSLRVVRFRCIHIIYYMLIKWSAICKATAQHQIPPAYMYTCWIRYSHSSVETTGCHMIKDTAVPADVVRLITQDAEIALCSSAIEVTTKAG